MLPEEKPDWLDKWVWQSLWKVVVVALLSAAGVLLAWRTQHLIRLVAVSLFFALAILPGVKAIHERWRWRRGAAVGLIYAALTLAVILMVMLIIPAITRFAEQIAEHGLEWLTDLNQWASDTLGVTLFDSSTAKEAASSTSVALSDWVDNILGLASSGIGLVFDIATIALFTFYFAADAPRIERALMSRMAPHRQSAFGWVWDTAIAQTGGYFYSRLLLMIINGGLFLIVMLLVGMPLVYALPLAAFEGFVAEFIPAVGTYIGAAVPILLTLAVLGLVSALILLAWTLVYQQAENYWLSPKLSAKTMSINGGVAFGAALAGGAIAGPMGAFVALPVAALITSIITNSGRKYDVVFTSNYASLRSPDGSPSDSGTPNSGSTEGSSAPEVS